MGLIEISNRYLSTVNWMNSSACVFNVSEHVDVWKIEVSADSLLLDSFLAIMPPGEIDRANRYFQTKDKNRYITSRGALRNILGEYLNQPPASVTFGIDIGKKPFILNTGATPLHYNISHSGNWILLAVSTSTIGADIELINYSFDYKEVIDDIFNPEEVNYIKQTQPIERFFQLWTRKEALTKATGKGLDDNMKAMPGLDGVHFVQSNLIASSNNWLISSFNVQGQYEASIASNPAISEMLFWDVCFKPNGHIL
jgi:4'-phosphopantetheinyl transferase